MTDGPSFIETQFPDSQALLRELQGAQSEQRADAYPSGQMVGTKTAHTGAGVHLGLLMPASSNPKKYRRST